MKIITFPYLLYEFNIQCFIEKQTLMPNKIKDCFFNNKIKTFYDKEIENYMFVFHIYVSMND